MKLPQTLLGPRFFGRPALFLGSAGASDFRGRPGPRLAGAAVARAGAEEVLGTAKPEMGIDAPPNRAMIWSTCCRRAAN